MKKFALGRGLSVVAGLFLIAASNPATAAPLPTSAGAVDVAAKPLGLLKPTTAAVATVSGSVIQATPAAAVSVTLAPAIAKEAAWLRSAGWPLYALVDRYSTGAPLDQEANCIAVAVYHEARGETLEGQLAVA
ncbi:MAG TPA: hypothetical protein VFT40_09150, partial [Sphingomicrobium sp.]|nr:hypothetical protein [Sphingomicrobium sp.]